MEWLAHDDVPFDALPEWARAPGESLDEWPAEVTVHPAGLVLSRSLRPVRVRAGLATKVMDSRLKPGNFAAVRWDEILVAIRLDEPRRLLIAAARRPPRPPWFELAGMDVARIEEIVRTRLDAVGHGTYRERRRTRAVVPPDEVLTQVLDRRPLPGAVEIPAGGPSVLRGALAGASIGGLLGVTGLAFGPSGLLVAGAMGALGGGAVLGGIEYLRGQRSGRVLVLTPDAFVGGLDGRSVSAVPWFRVGRFVEGVDDSGEAALEVFGPTGELIARVAGRFFGRPLDVIVAVAEAYRRRATEGA